MISATHILVCCFALARTVGENLTKANKFSSSNALHYPKLFPSKNLSVSRAQDDFQ